MSNFDKILSSYTDPSRENPLPMVIAGAATREDGLVYLGASGKTNVVDGTDVTTDTPVAFYSCTKAITTTALLKCLELGLIDLIDDPVEKYVPEIKDSEVFDLIGPDGKVETRKPKVKPTIRHLMTHTSGFLYSFFSNTYKKILDTNGVGNIMELSWKHFKLPLIFEPGTKWHYGISIDWIGRVIYHVLGTDLDSFCKKYIFNPIGADSITFIRTKEQIATQAEIHKRKHNTHGDLVPLVGIHPEVPEFHAGGHGAWGKVEDYLKFLQIFIHEGKTRDGVEVLKKTTIDNYSLKNLVPEDVSLKPTLEYPDPSLLNPIELFDQLPVEKLGWTSSFQLIDLDFPTGRKAPHYNWCGLPNLYYWIDTTSGVVGMFATQLFPFYDKTALEGFGEFETEVYKTFVK